MPETVGDTVSNFSGCVYIVPAGAVSESYAVILLERLLTFIPPSEGCLADFGRHFPNERVTAGGAVLKLLGTTCVDECFDNRHQPQELALIPHLGEVVLA